MVKARYKEKEKGIKSIKIDLKIQSHLKSLTHLIKDKYS